jgi:hypothetical protein
MRRLHFALLPWLLAATAGACWAEPMIQNGGRSTDLPRPRDGNVAVQEELDAARRSGTIAAYDLFIARHPDHPLAETARRERAARAERSGKRG